METAYYRITIKAIPAVAFGTLLSIASAYATDCDVKSGSNLFIGDEIAHNINTSTTGIDSTRLPQVCNYNLTESDLTAARKPERMQA